MCMCDLWHFGHLDKEFSMLGLALVQAHSLHFNIIARQILFYSCEFLSLKRDRELAIKPRNRYAYFPLNLNSCPLGSFICFFFLTLSTEVAKGYWF